MAKEAEHRCAGQVWGGWQFYSCSRKGKYHEDGKWWCGIHCPSKAKAREGKREAKRQKALDEKNARYEKRYRREAAERKACANIPTEALEAGVVGKLLEACRAVLRYEWTAAEPMLGKGERRRYPFEIAEQLRAAVALADPEAKP